MLIDMFHKLPVKMQGYIALIIGIILILVGALSELKIIEYMLKMILIGLGLIATFWGLKKSDVTQSVKSLIRK